MRNAARQSESLSYRVFSSVFLLFSYFLCGKTISIIVLPFFVYFQYIYTARQFRQLSYCVKLLVYATRDGKTIKSIVLPCFGTARQSTRLSYRDSKHQDNSYNCLTPFSLHLLHLHSLTLEHTLRLFQVFNEKLADSLLVFQVLCNKLAGLDI